MIQRLIRIEVLLENHLRHHFAWYVPLSIAMIAIAINLWLKA